MTLTTAPLTARRAAMSITVPVTDLGDQR